MCQPQYDITFEDLNPTFLFSCEILRQETEQAHRHDFIEIGIILDGEGEFSVDDKVFPVRKGDLLLFFNPGMLHQSRRINEKNRQQNFTPVFQYSFSNMEYNQILFPLRTIPPPPKGENFPSSDPACGVYDGGIPQHTAPERYFYAEVLSDPDDPAPLL